MSASATTVTTPTTGSRPRLLLALASTAVALAAADTYVVVLALTDMMTGVGIGLDNLQRAAPIISGFLLGYVAVPPLIGRLRLEPIATSGDLTGCGTFAVDADHDLVFAAYKGDPPGIATLRLDRGTGELTELARRGTTDSMTYLSLVNEGRALLGASYGGGFGAVWPVEGPALGEPHSRFTHANLHCIVPHADGDAAWVYAVSLGDDLIAQFSVDADGHLSPLDPAVVHAPPGSGPRHLVTRGSNAYVMTEFSGELIRFGIRPGGVLERAEAFDVVDPSAGLRQSDIDADPKQEPLIWGADVHLAGGYALTSERSSSRLTSVRLGDDHRLDEVVAFADTEKTPRGFNVTGDGRFVVAVGEDSTHAQLLELGDDGTLTERDRVGIGRGANWVRFA